MQTNRFETWWNAHPVFKNLYVPLVLTATFIVTFIDLIGGK